MPEPIVAVISPEEAVRARHHLGYMQVSAAASMHLGVPAATHTSFAVEVALTKLMPGAHGKFQQLLCRLDDVEQQIFCLDTNDLESIDGMKFNSQRLATLVMTYGIARDALANMLGVAPNPFDQRAMFQAPSLNVPVY